MLIVRIRVILLKKNSNMYVLEEFFNSMDFPVRFLNFRRLYYPSKQHMEKLRQRVSKSFNATSSVFSLEQVETHRHTFSW